MAKRRGVVRDAAGMADARVGRWRGVEEVGCSAEYSREEAKSCGRADDGVRGAGCGGFPAEHGANLGPSAAASSARVAEASIDER